MDKSEIIFQATPSPLNHVLTTIFIIITVGGYFVDVNYFVLFATGFIALVMMLNEDVSIFVCSDKFVIRYNNYFGKLMCTDLVYLYSDIKRYDYKIEKWEARSAQTIFITLINLLLPGDQISPLTEANEIDISIEYLNDFREICIKQINFKYRGKRYPIALENIKAEINKI